MRWKDGCLNHGQINHFIKDTWRVSKHLEHFSNECLTIIDKRSRIRTGNQKQAGLTFKTNWLFNHYGT